MELADLPGLRAVDRLIRRQVAVMSKKSSLPARCPQLKRRRSAWGLRMTPKEWTLYHIGVPVMFAKQAPNSSVTVGGAIRGTAFSIGGQFWLTAAHVMQALADDAELHPFLVLYSPERRFRVAMIDEWETLGADVALLRVDYHDEGAEAWHPVLNWQLEPLPAFEPVRAVGYPFGLVNEQDRKGKIIARGFGGHIVAYDSHFHLPQTDELCPVFELSFATPKGLSGSALLGGDVGVRVSGIVIGNTEQSMLVYTNREKVEERGETTIVEQYSTMTLGIAVQARHIAALPSKMLGSLLREHLQAGGRL